MDSRSIPIVEGRVDGADSHGSSDSGVASGSRLIKSRLGPRGGDDGLLDTKALRLPLRVSLVWLVGTYLLFLLVGEVSRVNNLWLLTAFVSATILLFAAGYVTGASKIRGRALSKPQAVSDDEVRSIRTLVVLSALYYLAYGLIYAGEYGIESPVAVLTALTDPGAAYAGKFGVYETQIATGRVSGPGQVITLLAVLSAPLVPLGLVYWKKLTVEIRILGILGLASYCGFFLSIGTLSGLGGVLIFAAVTLMVMRAQGVTGRRRRRGPVVAATLLGVIFIGYMSYAQGARVDTFGIGYRYEPNPVIERLTNTQFATGLVVTSFYPTHGYQGLSYNLDVAYSPGSHFEWTKMRGASRALDGYWSQYGLGDSVAGETYPAQTERITGWPQGQFWSTIYPWLASDLTFPGAALFMFLVGRWLARLWYESVYERSKLSLMLLCQLGVLIAFVPANNQLGIGRPSLICVTMLVSVYVARSIHRMFASKPRLANGRTRR